MPKGRRPEPEWELVSEPQHEEEAPSSSAGPACSRPPASRGPGAGRPPEPPTSPTAAGASSIPAENAETPEELYYDALEQASALLADTDPQASHEQVAQVCEEMARTAVYEEAALRLLQGNLTARWAMFTELEDQRPHINKAAEQLVLTPAGPEARPVPQVRHSRRRRDEAAGEPSKEVPVKSSAEPAEELPSRSTRTVPEQGRHWQRMVARIQDRKKWSTRGHMLNYSKNGMPRSVDGPATGLGKHLGRWGWREIRPHW